MSHRKAALTKLILSSFFLCGEAVWASPIVMSLSITDPLQSTAPGSVVTFHFALVNTLGTDLPVFGFVNLNPPEYLSEIVEPFTLPANATVTGTLSFQVASTATFGLRTFATNAASTLHDPVSGNSYSSNFATMSVDVVPEPSMMIPSIMGLGALLLFWLRVKRTPLAETEGSFPSRV